MQSYLDNQNLKWQDSVHQFLGTALRLASLPERWTSNIPFAEIVERSRYASLAGTADLHVQAAQRRVEGDILHVAPLPVVGEVVVIAEEEVGGGEDLLHHLRILPVGLALGLGQVVLRPGVADDLSLHHPPHVPTASL